MSFFHLTCIVSTASASKDDVKRKRVSIVETGTSRTFATLTTPYCCVITTQPNCCDNFVK